MREILAYDSNSRGDLHYRAPTNTYWGPGISPHPTAWHRRNLRYGEPFVERIHGAEPFVERIHGAEVTMLPDVGHVPIYDDPEQVVAHILSVTASVDAVREVAK